MKIKAHLLNERTLRGDLINYDPLTEILTLENVIIEEESNGQKVVYAKIEGLTINKVYLRKICYE